MRYFCALTRHPERLPAPPASLGHRAVAISCPAFHFQHVPPPPSTPPPFPPPPPPTLFPPLAQAPQEPGPSRAPGNERSRPRMTIHRTKSRGLTTGSRLSHSDRAGPSPPCQARSMPKRRLSRKTFHERRKRSLCYYLYCLLTSAGLRPSGQREQVDDAHPRNSKRGLNKELAPFGVRRDILGRLGARGPLHVAITPTCRNPFFFPSFPDTCQMRIPTRASFSSPFPFLPSSSFGDSRNKDSTVGPRRSPNLVGSGEEKTSPEPLIEHLLDGRSPKSDARGPGPFSQETGQ